MQKLPCFLAFSVLMVSCSSKPHSGDIAFSRIRSNLTASLRGVLEYASNTKTMALPDTHSAVGYRWAKDVERYTSDPVLRAKLRRIQTDSYQYIIPSNVRGKSVNSLSMNDEVVLAITPSGQPVAAIRKSGRVVIK